MIREITTAESLWAEVRPSYRPRAIEGTWDWICKNGRMQDGSPFDGDRIPWCKGVCDAWDNQVTREIDLQWGTRLGKTTIAMQILAKSAATKPMPGLFATSTQTLAKRIVNNKIYPILHKIKATRGQLPNKRFWTSEEIRLTSSNWHVAWSGSDTQLADLSAFYGWGNEIDKWSMDEKLGGEAGEGDSLDQFEERFKEFLHRKLLFECSPSTKRHSRIEKKLLASNNCRYWVPCPRCGGYQVLTLGANDPTKGGILFDALPDGTHDANLALATGRYVCCHCKHEIYDDRRLFMMRSGVWAPEGCSVDKFGRVVGTPKRSERAWGGQLSSLYSLQSGWGEIAEKFVKSKVSPRHLRMFVNGWLAETWEPHKSKSEPEQVGERLKTDVPRGVIPVWATWLFAAVDVQGDHFVFVVVACGPGEREHLVDHGTCETLDEIETLVIRKEFAHEDGGESLCPARTFIDSGFKTKEIYSFCKRFARSSFKVEPCKGENTEMGGQDFRVMVIGLADSNHTKRTKDHLLRAGQGLKLVRVSPYYYEPITQDQIDVLSPGHDYSFSLHAEAWDDQGFLRQLCNGVESVEPSKNNPDRHLWVKRWEGEPNDYRDAKKYVRCAMDRHFRVKKIGWKAADTRQPAIKAVIAPRPAMPEAPSRRDREKFRPQLRRSARR